MDVFFAVSNWAMMRLASLPRAAILNDQDRTAAGLGLKKRDMAFNMGYRVLQFKNTMKAVEEGRYEDAAKGMLASKWAKQTKSRAVRLAEMMKTGRDYE